MNDLVRYVGPRLVYVPFAALVCLTAHVSQAQQGTSIAGQPVIAAASFAGYDALSNDLELIGDFAGKPALKDMLQGFVSMATGGNGLEGVNRAEPWGAVLYGSDFNFVAFIPAHDPAAVIVSLRAASQGKLREQQQGIFLWEQNGRSFHVTAKGNFVWITNDVQQLDSFPVANPRGVLGELAVQYDVAVRLHVQSLPKSFRQLFVNGVESGYNQMIGEMFPRGDSTGGSAARQFASLRRTLDELDTITVGWDLDESRGEAELDVAYTAVKGTKLSRSVQQLQSRPSRFAGFVSPEATFSTSITQAVDESRTAVLADSLDKWRRRVLNEIANGDSLKTDTERDLAEQVAGTLFDEAQALLRQESIDFVASVIGKPANPTQGNSNRLQFDQLTFLAAIEVEDESRLERFIRKLANQRSPRLTVTWNAFNHDGIRFHKFLLPVDGDQRHIFGDTMDVVVGFGPRSCYLAGGHDVQQSIISAIERSKTQAGIDVTPVRFSCSISDCILCSQNEAPFKQLHELWREFTENDKMHLSLLPIERGGKLQFKFEKGVVHGFCRSIGKGIDQRLQVRQGR